MDSKFYILDINENIKFTTTGLDHLKPLFELSGIDIYRIETLKDYRQARIQASPFFMQHLSERADGWPDTDQFQLLKVAIFREDNDLEREKSRFDIKSNLQIIK
jgi:hypothetical protein